MGQPDRYAGGTQGGKAGGPGSGPNRGRPNRGNRERGTATFLKRRRRRRRDIRQTRRLTKTVRETANNPFGEALAPVTTAQARKLAKTIARSRRRGTYNRKDRQATRKLLNTLNKTIKSKDTAEPLDSEMRAARRLVRVAHKKGRVAKKPYRGDSDRVKGPDHTDESTRLHPKKGKKGNKDNNKGGKRRRRRGGGSPKSRPGINYTGTPGYEFNERDARKRARDLVQADTNAQLRAKLAELRQGKNSYTKAVRQEKNLGKRRREDLNYIFGETADYLAGLEGDQNTRYDNRADNLKELFGNLEQKNQNVSDRNYNELQSEMRRLGIEGGLTGNFQRDANFMEMLGNTSEGNALANLQSDRRSAKSIMDMFQGTMKGERASQIGQAWNDQGDALADIRSDYGTLFSNLRGDISDIRANKGKAIQELLMTLEDQGYQRFAEGRQQDFMNQMMANEFNLDVDHFNLDVAKHRNSLAQQRAAQRALRRRRQQERQAQNINNNLKNILSGLPFLG